MHPILSVGHHVPLEVQFGSKQPTTNLTRNLLFLHMFISVQLKFPPVAINAVGAELALVHPALFVVLCPVDVHVFNGSVTVWTFIGRLGRGMSIFDMR